MSRRSGGAEGSCSCCGWQRSGSTCSGQGRKHGRWRQHGIISHTPLVYGAQQRQRLRYGMRSLRKSQPPPPSPHLGCHRHPVGLDAFHCGQRLGHAQQLPHIAIDSQSFVGWEWGAADGARRAAGLQVRSAVNAAGVAARQRGRAAISAEKLCTQRARRQAAAGGRGRRAGGVLRAGGVRAGGGSVA